MTVTAPLKKSVVLPFGEYQANLMSVDEGEPGPHGELWKWTFTITAGEFTNSEIVGITSVTYSDWPSKSYRWAKALGHPPDIDFNASLIQGKPCRLQIAVEEKEDGGERYVLDENAVKPPFGAQTELAPAQPEPVPSPVAAALPE